MSHQEIMKTLEFQACDACRVGRPPLCSGCLHNREVISKFRQFLPGPAQNDKLKLEIEALNVAVDEANKRYDESQRMLRARVALVEEIEKVTDILSQIVDITVIEELRAEVDLAQQDNFEKHKFIKRAIIYIDTLEAMVTSCINEMPEPVLRNARTKELEALKREFRPDE